VPPIPSPPYGREMRMVIISQNNRYRSAMPRHRDPDPRDRLGIVRKFESISNPITKARLLDHMSA
jgi:hypothetical protein